MPTHKVIASSQKKYHDVLEAEKIDISDVKVIPLIEATQVGIIANSFEAPIEAEPIVINVQPQETSILTQLAVQTDLHSNWFCVRISGSIILLFFIIIIYSRKND